MRRNIKLNLIFLEAERELPVVQKRKMRRIIQLHSRKAARLFGVRLLNIIVYSNKERVIPETGEAAYAEGKDFIKITIDPARSKKRINQMIAEIIPATLYHEINHLAREKYIGPAMTLLDAVISEGLADEFAKEKWPKFQAPWAKYTLKEIRPFIGLLRQEKGNKKYSHDEWFFGAGQKLRWLGYKLGSYIVQAAKELRPNLTAQNMTRLRTGEILKLSGLAI